MGEELLKTVSLSMDLQTRKLHFIEEILSIGNEQVIEKLEALLKKEQKKVEGKRISIEGYNKEIDEANSWIKSGKYASHEGVKTDSETWLK